MKTSHGKFKETSNGKVIADYESAFSDPLKIRVGERVTISDRKSEWVGWVWCTTKSGIKGWVPDKYLEKKGNTGEVKYDYDATELTVKVGEELEILEEESGWVWCCNNEGMLGWVPMEHINTI